MRAIRDPTVCLDGGIVPIVCAFLVIGLNRKVDRELVDGGIRLMKWVLRENGCFSLSCLTPCGRCAKDRSVSVPPRRRRGRRSKPLAEMLASEREDRRRIRDEEICFPGNQGKEAIHRGS